MYSIILYASRIKNGSPMNKVLKISSFSINTVFIFINTSYIYKDTNYIYKDTNYIYINTDCIYRI